MAAFQRPLITGLLLGLAVSTLACTMRGEEPLWRPLPGTPNTIAVVGGGLDPSELTIASGTVVTWILVDWPGTIILRKPVPDLCGSPWNFYQTGEGDYASQGVLSPGETASLCVAGPGVLVYEVFLRPSGFGGRASGEPLRRYGRTLIGRIIVR
jgi:hypothetical protein